MALKGQRAPVEIDEATQVFKKNKVAWVDLHEVEVKGTDESTNIVVVAKK